MRFRQSIMTFLHVDALLFSSIATITKINAIKHHNYDNDRYKHNHIQSNPCRILITNAETGIMNTRTITSLGCTGDLDQITSNGACARIQ